MKPGFWDPPSVDTDFLLTLKEDLTKDEVLVCSSCYNKNTVDLGDLNHKDLFLQFWKLEV